MTEYLCSACMKPTENPVFVQVGAVKLVYCSDCAPKPAPVIEDDPKEDLMIEDWIKIVQIAASDLPVKRKKAMIKKAGWVKSFKTNLDNLSAGVGP